MNPPMAYLASPIDEAPPWVEGWRVLAREVLREQGYTIYDPSMAWSNVDGDADRKALQYANDAAINVADLVLAVWPYSVVSVGVPKELELARSLGKHVFVARIEDDLHQARRIGLREDPIQTDERWDGWLTAVALEMERAQLKFPRSDENSSTDWFGIFIEEVMEVTQAWNDGRRVWAASPGPINPETLRETLGELEQTGAMAGRLWMKLSELLTTIESQGSTTSTPEDGGTSPGTTTGLLA